MQEKKYPSPDLVAHWCALLDGELTAEQSQSLMAEVEAHPESKSFLDNQTRFNQALTSAMTKGLPTQLPAQLSLQVLAALRENPGSSDVRNAVSSNLRLVDDRGVANQRRGISLGLGWSLAGMAAMLIIGLTVGSLLLSPKQAPINGISAGIPPVKTIDPTLAAIKAESDQEVHRLEVYGSKATELMLNIGNDPDTVAEYAKAHGYSSSLPCHPGFNGSGQLSAVNYATGKLEGLEYQAITLCSGPRDAVSAGEPQSKSECPTNGKLNRIVLFIVNGDLRPCTTNLDEKGCWNSCMVGRSYAARWDPESKKTYLVYFPGNLPPKSVREYAEPLITLDATPRNR